MADLAVGKILVREPRRASGEEQADRRRWRRLFAAAPVIAVLSVAVLLASANSAAASTDTRAGHVMRVTARDDNFTLNTTRVASGLVTTTLHNSGDSPHQAQIGRLKAGATIDQFAADISAHKIKDALGLIAGFYGGPVVVLPGHSQTTYQNLASGHYVLLCFVPDTMAPHLPHFAMGMFAGFDVIGANDSDTPDRVSGAVFAVDNMHYVIPRSLRTGTTVRFQNDSTKDVHEFGIGKLLPGKSVTDVVNWAKTEQGPPPFMPMGGAGAINPHGRVWFTLKLPPGSYIALCLVPDTEPPNLPHAAMGMVSAFTVTR